MSMIDKFPNWLRYILAIPFGILCLYIVYYMGYFSSRFIASPDSWLMIIYNFLYANGINVLVMMAGMNYMLPKYQFGFTLTVSLIFCSIGMIGLGMSIITKTVTVPYIIGLILTFIAFIYSCYVSFEDEEKNNQIYSNSYQVENIEEISNIEKIKYVKLAEIVMNALGTTNIGETLEQTYKFYENNGVDMNSIKITSQNPYIILAEIMMQALGTHNIDDTIDKAIEFYREQGIDIK